VKRSAKVELVLLLSAAASYSACNQRRRCVDANNLIVDENHCATAGYSGGTSYHWYYGGWGSRPGSRATGGSAESSTAHGVFGGAGEAHGGGAHGGGAGE